MALVITRSHKLGIFSGRGGFLGAGRHRDGYKILFLSICGGGKTADSELQGVFADFWEANRDFAFSCFEACFETGIQQSQELRYIPDPP